MAVEPSRFERVMWRRRRVGSPVTRWEIAGAFAYWLLVALYLATGGGWLVALLWSALAAAWTVAVYLRWKRLGITRRST
jgi:hypothetical protein